MNVDAHKMKESVEQLESEVMIISIAPSQGSSIRSCSIISPPHVHRIAIFHGWRDPLSPATVRYLPYQVELLSQLNHPNIVKYVGTLRQSKRLFIFLEYVPGGSISGLLTRFGPLNESVIRVYTRQILKGDSRRLAPENHSSRANGLICSERICHPDLMPDGCCLSRSGLPPLDADSSPGHQGRKPARREKWTRQACGLRNGQADGGAHVLHAVLQGERVLDGAGGDQAAGTRGRGRHLVRGLHCA